MPSIAATISDARIKFGLSLVTVPFPDHVDVYFARQLVQQRLNDAKGALPAGVESALGPVSTPMGELYQYVLTSDSLSQIIRFYGNAMQGMMGGYIEKNIETFMQIQNKLQDQSRQVYGQNPMLNSETWNEFVKMQAPAMQGLMGRYLEQSAQTFLNMQNQLTTQTRNLWGNFPFPGFPGAGDSKKDGEEPKS